MIQPLKLSRVPYLTYVGILYDKRNDKLLLISCPKNIFHLLKQKPHEPRHQKP